MRAFVSVSVLLLLGIACKKPEPVLVSPREVHTPGLDAGRLAQTDAAQRGSSGKIKVAYCIDAEGETRNVEVTESFGDPQVDALVVETVDGWRYEPATRDGEPFEQCTDYTFELNLGT